MTDGEKLDLLIEKVLGLEQKVISLDEKVVRLDKRTARLEMEVASIKVTLENETNRNIKIIAEGHLDLSRKLNESIKIASDIQARQEVQDVYLNMHESKLRSFLG